jgi:hypothetical protein
MNTPQSPAYLVFNIQPGVKVLSYYDNDYIKSTSQKSPYHSDSCTKAVNTRLHRHREKMAHSRNSMPS